MSTLRHSRNTLAPVSHTQLLEAILAELKKQQVFRITSSHLSISTDDVAIAAAKKLKTSFATPVIGSASSMRTASVNMNDKTEKEFSKLLKNIFAELRQQFERSVAPLHLSPHAYLTKGLQSLQHLKDQVTMKTGATSSQHKPLGLLYSFPSQQTLQSKQLHVLTNPQDIGKAHFRLSRVKMDVSNLNTFSDQIDRSLQELCRFEQCMKAVRGDQEAAEELHEDLMEMLQASLSDPSSEFAQLQRFLEDETVGQLKKMASLEHLRYFQNQHTKNHITLASDLKDHSIYWQTLDRLIARLDALQACIWDSSRSESDYDGYYENCTFNFRDLAARANLLTKAPVIPFMEGSLGETASKDQGVNSFLFGAKLKLGGSVPARQQIPTGGGQEKIFDVYNYYLNLLDSKNQAHQEGIKGRNAQSFVEKIMTVLLVYSFLFKEDETGQAPAVPFDPAQHFLQEVVAVFKQSDVQRKSTFLAQEAFSYRRSTTAHTQITRLQKLFRSLMKQRTQLFLPHTAHLDICVRRGLLEQHLPKIRGGSFFLPNMFSGTHKKALKYVTIDPTGINSDVVCKLDATIEMDDVLFLPDEALPDAYDLHYDLADTMLLPVYLLPVHSAISAIYQQYVQSQWYISFPYKVWRPLPNAWSGNAGYIYRTTHALLMFLTLFLFLQYLASSEASSLARTFLAIFRFHVHTEDQSVQETFMANLSRILAHLFSETCQAEHQGLYIGDLAQTLERARTHYQEQQQQASSQRTPAPFRPPRPSGEVVSRLRNAQSSLYSRLSRIAEIPHRKNDPFVLEKLAMLVVSGRESDATWTSNDFKRLTMYGQINTFDALGEGRVRVCTNETFAYNLDSDQAYTAPVILADLTNALYERGYKHVLYLAHSPHSSTLRIQRQVGSQSEEHRFFMDENVLRTMKGNRADLLLYPIFFDSFYVSRLVPIKKDEVRSFYIHKVEELSHILQDPSQRIVPFFYLFNNLLVGSEEKYHGVTAYSTFWNFYSNDIVANQNIHLGLLYEQGPLRRDILTFLTLFHFLSNEKSVGPTALRRDPYRAIFGDESVGRRALYAHGNPTIQFNMLSFLTEVRKIAHTFQV